MSLIVSIVAVSDLLVICIRFYLFGSDGTACVKAPRISTLADCRRLSTLSALMHIGIHTKIEQVFRLDSCQKRTKWVSYFLFLWYKKTLFFFVAKNHKIVSSKKERRLNVCHFTLILQIGTNLIFKWPLVDMRECSECIIHWSIITTTFSLVA